MWAIRAAASYIFPENNDSSESEETLTYFDEAVMKKYVGEDIGYHSELIPVFFQSVSDEFELFQSGLENFDFEQMERAAHSIKSNSALLGLISVTRYFKTNKSSRHFLTS